MPEAAHWIGCGPPCEECRAPSVGMRREESGRLVSFCQEHSPLVLKMRRDQSDELTRLRAALREARTTLREVAADDDPRDGCAHSGAAKATLAKIAEVVPDE